MVDVAVGIDEMECLDSDDDDDDGDDDDGDDDDGEVGRKLL